MQELQTIEGVTPGMLWTALIVLIAGAGLYVLYGKVRDTWHKQQEYKQMQNDPGERLADDISEKVLQKLEPRFAEIDKKLANDKAVIESHTRQIEALNKRVDSSETGIRALCRGMLALLNNAKQRDGASEEINKATTEFTDYLADK